jgi:hypothetical protein
VNQEILEWIASWSTHSASACDENRAVINQKFSSEMATS